MTRETSVPSMHMRSSHVRKDPGESIQSFDQAKIFQHYHILREQQQEMLAKINMSEALKKELFGFDEEYYCTNSNDGISLIIENHPLKGKSIMTRERYEANQKMQRRIEGVKASSANEDCCPEEGNILDSQGSANGNSFSGGSMVEHSQRTF